MILLVGNTKGGCGKSTTTVNIASARAARGRDVLVVDGDRHQRSTQISIAIRNGSGKHRGITCVAYPDGPVLRDQVRLQAAKYDDVLIDAGGRDSSALRAAIGVCDVMLAPFMPSSYDTWALDELDEVAAEVVAAREAAGLPSPRLCAFLMAANWKKDSANNRDSLATLGKYPRFEQLRPILCQRTAFKEAAASGLSVFEHRPRDAKACAELEELLEVVF